MANKKNNSPMQVSFWLNKINPKTNKFYTVDEATYHIKTFRKTNIEYWISRGYSEKDAKENIQNFQKMAGKRGIEERKKHPEYDPVHIEYWLNNGYSLDDAKTQLSKRQATFSKEICILKYGNKKGITIFNKRQKKWQNTLNTKSKKELADINKRKNSFSYFFNTKNERNADFWKKWKKICKLRHLKYIDNIEELKKYIILIYKNTQFLIEKGTTYFINNCCPSYLYKTLKVKKTTIKKWLKDEGFSSKAKIYKVNGKYKSYHMPLKDGTILRSKLEIQFFNKLLYYSLTIDDANMNYSNSNYKYDFKVNGKIIEIAGILNNPVYKSILLYKQQTFKPFILTSATEFDDFIENVLIKNDEEKIKYYIERPL